MATQLKLGEIDVDVVLKDIKNVHLSVHPPTGRVTVSAPSRMSLDTIRVYALTKLPWIRQQQNRLRAQERETPRDYVERESHYLWGRRYLLKIIEADASPRVDLKHREIVLHARPGTDTDRRQAILADWYRRQLKRAATPLIDKWQKRMGVTVERFFVQRMKTKWGSCNAATRTIRLNTELARKPPECLEYIVVHELAHLIERHHNDRFVAILDRYLPQWKTYRDELNAAPLAHEDWTY
jgi:predicted metal-dependent hydrolase